jgi:hypothetical protein
VAQRTAAFWSSQGFTPEQVAGIMAGGPGAESSFNPAARGDGDTSYGLYQHHLGRKEMMQARYGPNPTEAQQHAFAAWEISPEGPLAAVGAKLKQAKTPEEAARIWTLGFESPANAEARAAARAAVAPRYLNYGNAGPRVANAALPVAPGTAPPPFNPNAGPRTDGAPPAGTPPGVAPLVPVPGAPTVTASPPPTVQTSEAEDAPAVEPSRLAMRLGGTDTAGPGAGQVTMGPVEQPNTLYQTGLPGITIRGPGNGLAPPPAAAAPVTAPAAPAGATPPPPTRPAPLPPPPAAARTIPLEPLIQSGPGKDLTPAQFKQAGLMIGSGTPIANVMAHVEQWRQQNVARREQATAAAAAQQQQDYQRQEDYRKAQIEAEKTQFDRAEKAKADAIAAAVEKRAADKAAAEAADPLQGKSEDERIERTLLQIAPKLRPGYSGQPPTDAEKDQYTLLWNKFREGPLQQVPDGKGGFFTARVPRDVPPQFPPPPGQTIAPGPQAIPGTERQPEVAPPTITGGMLANGQGQRKILTALAGLQAHPDAVGIKGNAPEWLLQRADEEGIALRAAVSNVAGHEFHDLSGAAVSPSEASRLKFIPSEKDTAFALKTKLQQMLDQNRDTLLQSYRTYGPENGFRKAQAVEDAIVDSIPEAAMTMLKAQPETARKFDKVYGKGAAKLVLQYGG